eukprot:TRINITY_DN68675_c0_g1_i1.p1 TRINITY_DN68675_c0_g1~~TRINITY_DN68675_c0_g1_i1.p1  ORF type:complete len:588 (+),score=107.74 TRINITY_DN68675_c0_g1_i1:73-1836(+)
MAATMRLTASLFVALLSATAMAVSPADVRTGLRGGSSVTMAAIEQDLATEISGEKVGPKALHLAKLESLLRPLAVALPTDDMGRFNHAAVRYLIHRLFMQRHSWLIRGLEPDNETSTLPTQANFTIGSDPVWPSFLQRDLEQWRGSENLSLRDVAGLAATLDDLIHRENEHRLRKAYDVAGIETEAQLNYREAKSIMRKYFAIYVSAWSKPNLTAYVVDSITQSQTVRDEFPRVAKPVLDTLKRKQEINFENLLSVSNKIGTGYKFVNTPMCGGLKRQLLSMENRKAGRVRLSDFYNASLYGAWGFIEKVEYLRSLGTLDETNESNILVVIPNYVTAINQCLKASSIYTVCCPNECDPLMSALEAEIAAPQGDPDRILDFVANKMSTETVQAPRKIPGTLRDRLSAVASQTGGQVLLHGRLFAQWMHHAFPRECPFPHVVGTLSPRTADEWLRDTGHTETRAAEADMRQHIRHDDTCSIAPDATELPWSSVEQEFYGGKGGAATWSVANEQAEIESIIRRADEMGLALEVDAGGLGPAVVSLVSVAATAAILCLLRVLLKAIGGTSMDVIKQPTAATALCAPDTPCV